jgi:hypothetical protein
MYLVSLINPRSSARVGAEKNDRYREKSELADELRDKANQPNSLPKKPFLFSAKSSCRDKLLAIEGT